MLCVYIRTSKVEVGKDISMRVVITGDSCKVMTCEVSYEFAVSAKFS